MKENADTASVYQKVFLEQENIVAADVWSGGPISLHILRNKSTVKADLALMAHNALFGALLLLKF